MAIVHVHVTPRSARNEISGWRGGELLVKVTAPPEGGKANAAACKLLAGVLGVPKSSVSVVRGESSRHKSLVVEGLSDESVVGLLS